MNPYQYLNSLNKYGTEGGFKPGLERIEALLAEFEHPEKKLNIIHIAGTNGKGSTIAFLKEIYMEADYRVGVYTSPPLFTFNERIVINNDPIKTAQLQELVTEMNLAVNKVTEKVGYPSFFEVITALAFVYFYRQKVDLVLLEVGLGGRFDATNIIKDTLVSVITNISFEHTAILGDNIKDIAREKAGIIKHRRPVITAVKRDKALKVIKKIVREMSAEMVHVDKKYQYRIKESSFKGQKFQVNSNFYTGELEIGLLGKYQVRNAVLALAVIDNLKNKFLVTEKNIFYGFKHAKWPGRLEVINYKPLIIVDGAHNEAGIEELIDFLGQNISPNEKLTIILGVLNDKDIKSMLKVLKSGQIEFELAITVNKNKRALPPEEIKKIADELGIDNKIYSGIRSAIKKTFDIISPAGIICITGSLYTVAEAKNLLKTSDWLV